MERDRQFIQRLMLTGAGVVLALGLMGGLSESRAAASKDVNLSPPVNQKATPTPELKITPTPYPYKPLP